MATLGNEQLKQQVIVGAREYNIASLLFRHAIAERLGVNVTDMECLGLVFLKGVATPSELARYTGLSSGATTAMLDRLEKAGIIERRPNPNDRRSSHIVIMEQRAGEIGKLFATVREAQDEIVSSYTEAELALLIDFFNRSVVMWKD